MVTKSIGQKQLLTWSSKIDGSLTVELILAGSGSHEVLGLRLAADQVHAADVRLLSKEKNKEK